ncbi:hypothetical protein D3C87_1279270 [compost metagenome]
MGIQREHAFADHRADIQRLVEQGLDVHRAIAMPKNLQGVFNVLPLFGDDRLEQHGEYRAGDDLSGDVRLIETDETVAFIQTQQAVEFVLVTAGAELAQQGCFQVLIVLQHLQSLSGGVETGVGVTDHQRACQRHVIGLLFPQAHRLQGRAPGGKGSLIEQTLQGLALFGPDDLRLAFEQNLCARLLTDRSTEKRPTRSAVAGCRCFPIRLQTPEQQRNQFAGGAFYRGLPVLLVGAGGCSFRMGEFVGLSDGPSLMTVILQNRVAQ